jgi:hypothetical protein
LVLSFVTAALYDFTAALIELLALPNDVELSKLHSRSDVEAEKLVDKVKRNFYRSETSPLLRHLTRSLSEPTRLFKALAFSRWLSRYVSLRFPARQWNMATRHQGFRTSLFALTLARFVEEIVAPEMGVCGVGARVVYQERPSLRVQVTL